MKRLLSTVAALALMAAPFTPNAKADLPQTMPWGIASFRTVCATLNKAWAQNGTAVVCNAESDGLVFIGAHTLVSTADLQHRCTVMLGILSEHITPGPIKIEMQTSEDDIVCHR
jgi:hypothetical protein